MKKLNVIYDGWEERFVLGTLADNGQDIVFEYSREALRRKLEFSPLKMPLGRLPFSDLPDHQHKLPGFISDALPDGWGMLLMDRLFRKQGRNPSTLSPLDRLAYIGENAMGALAFEPAEGEALTDDDLHLLELSNDVQHVFDEDESESALKKLVFMGGSPHGARPKVLVNFNRETNRISMAASGNGTPMLVKFPAQNEHKEVCAIESLYCRLAQACDLSVPSSEYFELDKKLSAFAIERFDRERGMRIPMHTAAGAAHVDFRIPQLDYVSLLRLTKFMTNDSREVLHAFERCVFNVVFNNRDDHSKNFSFLMHRDGRWKFSPAYDITFSYGPNGKHQMDVCGEARSPGRKELLELAAKTGVKPNLAKEAIDRIVGASEAFSLLGGECSIREQTLKIMEKAVAANRERM